MSDQGKEKVHTFEVTVKYTYDVTESDLINHYDTYRPDLAAQIDQQNFRNIPYYVLEDMQNELDNLHIEVALKETRE